MKKLRKVVIPVAGLGIRMLPATKVIPKEMLPLAGKPIIQYIVKEALDSGFSEIIFVTHDNKAIVENFFKRSSKLESILEEKLQKTLLAEIKGISELGKNIVSVTQNKPKGLGHAILCARSLIAGEPFAVMLPDMVLDYDSIKNDLATMKNNFDNSGESSLLLAKVSKSEVNKYGIAKLRKRSKKDNFFPLEDIVEKPKTKDAPSNLFVTGRYVFDNEILKYLSKEKPDHSGEIQLTGAISSFLKSRKVINGLLLKGDVYDCGSKQGYLKANLALSLKDSVSKKAVFKFLKKKVVK
tara:strand:+ start:747 stop:1634 length:888 start_codon:yes stop_codon:yes gene_type:complete